MSDGHGDEHTLSLYATLPFLLLLLPPSPPRISNPVRGWCAGEGERIREGRRGGRAAGGRGVSIQLPRISSARGDSPPRICHLRGEREAGGRGGGGGGERARLPTDVTGQGGKFARNITTIYTPRYESLIQRHRLRRIGVVRDCRWSRLDERMCFFFSVRVDRAEKKGY